MLENEAHDATRRPELTAAIMEHFQDEAFRTNLDAVNYFHASEEGFPAAYEILKPYIGYVHLKNACLYREGAGQPRENEGAPMSGIYAGRPIPVCTDTGWQCKYSRACPCIEGRRKLFGNLYIGTPYDAGMRRGIL